MVELIGVSFCVVWVSWFMLGNLRTIIRRSSMQGPMRMHVCVEMVNMCYDALKRVSKVALNFAAVFTVQVGGANSIGPWRAM